MLGSPPPREDPPEVDDDAEGADVNPVESIEGRAT
jgi:hypothetical protein